jgi:hypothetical protein
VEIKTFSDRNLRSVCGPVAIRVAYVDEPATEKTWDRNADQIASEMKMDPLDAHAMLLRLAPHIYVGRR